jgi:3-dehydroquinate dehydratase
MGELGGATRVELAKRGSCLVYGFHDQANAPGQLSCAELRKQLT